jgi:hypothetical protein
VTDAGVLAGWLLAAGPVVGLIPVAHPALVPIWSMPREAFVATVGAHRTAWLWLNAGFALATVLTTGGIAALALAMPSGLGTASVLTCAVAYGIGGGLWCAVLAIRARTTPLLADLNGDSLSSRQVALLDAATGGLFQGFVLITGAALAALGLTLLLTGVVAAAVAVVVLLSGVAGITWLLISGDVIPAALFLPTMVLGVAVLVRGSP